jgi:hypothetical protein
MPAMPQPDPNYDYTRNESAALANAAAASSGPGSGEPVDADYVMGAALGTDVDYEIPDVQALDKSAQEIEAERSFSQLPPGEYELQVVGFLVPKGQVSPVKPETKDAYISGKRLTLQANSIVVRFALASDQSYQITDYFLLPPEDPDSLRAYYEGTKSPDSKPQSRGFLASKFFHFIERLGYPYPKGGKMPPEARKIKNWVGRRIHAVVIPGDPYRDPNTGQDKDGRSQIKLFSYRPTQETMEQYARAGHLVGGVNRPDGGVVSGNGSQAQGRLPLATQGPGATGARGSRAVPRPQPQPVASPAGLDNI